MKKLLLILVVISLGLSSCIKQEDVKFKGVHKVEINESSKLNLQLRVENSSIMKLKVKELSFAVDYKGHNFAKIMLADDIVVPRKSDDLVDAKIYYKLSNPLALLAFVGKNFSYSQFFNDLEVEGEITAKAGLMRKTYKVEKAPLIDVLKGLGLQEDELFKTLKK